MGAQAGKQRPRPQSSEKAQGVRNQSAGSCEATEDSGTSGPGEADVKRNNEMSSEETTVTDSTGAAGPKSAWPRASTADPGAARPHLVRLFSRDAPGREDNTFKDHPSVSDELHTIEERGGTGSEGGPDCTEREAD
ncbi:myelin basic protein-like [Scleropages formosus]|uniref:myelin basic protein-like n=1 Tax=Scleropages formosus TaxID=113540 RepID=UPI0010FA9EE9|nr:myelin basic protein-like [Scleropages formosus]